MYAYRLRASVQKGFHIWILYYLAVIQSGLLLFALPGFFDRWSEWLGRIVVSGFWIYGPSISQKRLSPLKTSVLQGFWRADPATTV